MRMLLLPLLLIVAQSSLGGEWHSAGNSPVASPLIYQPEGPLSYECELRVSAIFDGKLYRSEPVIQKVSEADFRATEYAAVSLRGPDDHSLRFSFHKDGEREIMDLNATICLPGGANISGTASVARSEKSVRIVVNNSAPKGLKIGKRKMTYINLVGSCRDLL